ncbi:MAG: oleate hydratase [Solirubrobacteraceae bacterium]
MWKRLASKDDAFGRPEVFCSSIAQTKWESATVTVRDPRIDRVASRRAKPS